MTQRYRIAILLTFLIAVLTIFMWTYMGPLPLSNGFTHLLTIVDHFSRWPEAIPITETSTTICVQALLYHWIACFGVPMDMSSDRRSQFTSQHLLLVSAYHLQSNGLVERFHYHLKMALQTRLTGPNWVQELPWVQLGIRTASKEDLGCPSAKLVYGTPHTVPGDFFYNCKLQPDHHSELQRLRNMFRH